MLVKTYCAAVNGLEVTTVTCEVSMSRGVQFHLTGLADTAVKESHDRIKAALVNNGTFGAIDSLTISYDGNQLVKVTDAAEALNYSDALDFHDGDDTACEYDYDSNGALTRDSNRGINSITYDYGHHAYYINMNMTSGPRNITNDYTPDGRKLLSKHVMSIPKVNGYTKKTTTDQYIDGLMLRGDTTLLWRFDGGYVDLNANGTPTSWNYYVTDHLGSTRMVVDSNNNILETINYYPFGSEMQMVNPALLTGGTSHPYRFTGKELDRMNSLNMYDFGARWYDVAGVPMWTSIDPLCEKYYHITPYSYCAGNPVIFVDPNGEEVYSDLVSQQNIKNTLTEKEIEYVDFDSNGQLNYELLCQFEGSSANMDALKLLAKSEIVYSFESKECDSEGRLFMENDNSYYRGVTEMPGAQTHPSIDGKVHIIVGSMFSKEQQAITLAHEGFGHGLVYEMTRDPNAASHHYKNKQGNSYMFNGVEYYDLIRYDSNEILKTQIDRVEEETKRNIHNRN